MDHLQFTKVDLPAQDRRRRLTVPPKKNRDDYSSHGNDLVSQIDNQTKETLSLAKKYTFSPYLLVKVELEKDVLLSEEDIDKLESFGLKVIDIESKELMVLFADDFELNEFHTALNNYKSGKIARTKVQHQDLFAMIKTLSRWNENDRKGQDLDGLLDEDYIDCYLWIFFFLFETKAKASEFLENAKSHIIKLCDKYISQSVSVVRLKVKKNELKFFLSHPLVYRVDKIPDYYVKVSERMNLNSITLNDINYNSDGLTEDSPAICVVDSGVRLGHPLIKDCIVDSKTFYVTEGYKVDDNDIDGHGTMVAGICEYGEIDVKMSFAPKIKLFSAKIHDGEYIGNYELCINELQEEGFNIDDTKFDLIYEYFSHNISLEELMNTINITNRKYEMKSIILKYTNIYEKLIPTQMRELVEYFYKGYGCRIFNLSQGDLLYPYDDGKPRAWTCVLDELQNEYDVIFVVSTGNYKYHDNCESDEDIIKSYPGFFYSEKNTRIIEPAASVSSVTVGGIAKSSIAFAQNKEQISSLSISKKKQISSITRVGPGIAGAIKPEFVAYSGDGSFDTLTKCVTYKNMGYKILSLSNNLQDNLFCYDLGTSFSAPYISHLLALISKKYPYASNNLLRAILACSSTIPDELEQQVDALIDGSSITHYNSVYTSNVRGVIRLNKNKVLHYTAGYGYPDEKLALDSFDNHVVLMADMKESNAIESNKTHIFEIPMPIEFSSAKGTKRLIISLAYNPEVRKTRLDYMGCNMSFELVRGQSLQDVYNVCSSQAGKENKVDRFESKYLCKTISCGKMMREHGTLQRGIFEFNRSDYGESYFLVVDCKKNWSTALQNYAVVVTYETSDETVKLYNLIRNRIRIRERDRIR